VIEDPPSLTGATHASETEVAEATVAAKLSGAEAVPTGEIAAEAVMYAPIPAEVIAATRKV
jgi:hypothetical protein